VLNVLATLVFGALFWLTARRGATDPVCGMTVDRDSALRAVHDGRTFYFCGEHCRQRFQADPGRWLEPGGAPPAEHAHAH